jgi:hypothetical protein
MLHFIFTANHSVWFSLFGGSKYGFLLMTYWSQEKGKSFWFDDIWDIT